jgi:purine-cytosine permease-like protein
LPSTGRLGWFVIGVILGAIVLGVYTAILIIIPLGDLNPRFGTGPFVVIRFLIQLVAWFGLMLAVAGSLGSRIIRQDKMNYILIGFGAIILTIELWYAIPLI